MSFLVHMYQGDVVFWRSKRLNLFELGQVARALEVMLPYTDVTGPAFRLNVTEVEDDAA